MRKPDFLGKIITKFHKRHPFGYELLLDCYNCRPELIDDIDVCYNFLEDAVDALGVIKQAPPYVFHSPPEFPDKAGISSWVPLIESGIQCHTLTAKNFVSIDYYTCSNLDKKMARRLLDLTRETFGPTMVDIQFIERGKHYYDD